MVKHSLKPIVTVIVGALLFAWTSQAQDDSLTLTLTIEHNIGWQCPLATTIQPQTDIVWVLMSNCRTSDLQLRTFDVKTGDVVNEPLPLIGDLVANAYDVTSYSYPLAFTPEGDLELFTANYESELINRYQINIERGEITSDEAKQEQLNTLLLQFTEYPAFAVTFSADHAFAVVGDEVASYVIDLATEELIFKIDLPSGFPAFSADQQLLYISAWDDPENYDSFAGSLYVYRMADGELLQTMTLPSVSVLYPSPDGRFVAIETVTSESINAEIGIVELATERLSNLQKIGTAPTPVLQCVNNGRSVADVNYVTSGHLPLKGVHWLADNSGFVTLNSAGNQIAINDCLLEVSRLRQYGVGE